MWRCKYGKSIAGEYETGAMTERHRYTMAVKGEVREGEKGVLHIANSGTVRVEHGSSCGFSVFFGIKRGDIFGFELAGVNVRRLYVRLYSRSR